MMEILFGLEEKIKKKNYQLTQISNENKDLKSANKKGIHFSDDSHDLNPEKD